MTPCFMCSLAVYALNCCTVTLLCVVFFRTFSASGFPFAIFSSITILATVIALHYLELPDKSFCGVVKMVDVAPAHLWACHWWRFHSLVHVLIPSNTSLQSMVRSCFACSSVVHRTRIPLASLLIPWSLTPGMEAFSTAHWHRSVISFGGIAVISSFTSSVVCFVVSVTSYFVRSWRRASHCCLCRACISTIFFPLYWWLRPW